MTRDNDGNVIRLKGYSYVCVWFSASLNSKVEFVEYFKNQFNVRIQFLEEVETIDRRKISETRGRRDTFFAVCDEDVSVFSEHKTALGIQWLSDIYRKGHGWQYPSRIEKYLLKIH